MRKFPRHGALGRPLGGERRFRRWLAVWLQERRRQRRFAASGTVPLAPDQMDDLLGWWDEAGVYYDAGTYLVQSWPAVNASGPELWAQSDYGVWPWFDVAQGEVVLGGQGYLTTMMPSTAAADLTVLVVGWQAYVQSGAPRYLSLENADLWLEDWAYPETLCVVHTEARGAYGAFEGHRNVDDHNGEPTVELDHPGDHSAVHIGVVRKSGGTLKAWLQYLGNPTVHTATGSTETLPFYVDCVSLGGAYLAGGLMSGGLQQAAIWLRALSEEEVEAVMAYFANLYA